MRLLRHWLLGAVWLPLVLSGQPVLREDFSDGNLTDNPAWAGQLASFRIRSGHLTNVQPGGGQASIQTSYAVNLTQHALEWRVRVAHSLASLSNSNRLRIYLMANGTLTNATTSGYYLELGDASADHAVKLIRQTGSTRLTVAQVNGVTRNAPNLGIRVRRALDGVWTLQLDPAGGQAYGPAVQNYDNTTQLGLAFGVVVDATVAGHETWQIDDLYAGPWETVTDLTAPRLLTWRLGPGDSLHLQFSEGLNGSRLEPARYTWPSGYAGSQQVVSEDARPDRVLLRLAPALAPGERHTLRLQGLLDMAGNELRDTTVQVRWEDVRRPQAGDVVLNELMADPDPPVRLPVAEYIEVHNRAAYALDMTSARLVRQGVSAVLLPADTIPAGGYRVYVSASVPAGLLLPNAKATALPAAWLPNSGDTLRLEAANGQVLDRLIYGLDTYGDAAKANGGWSLERVDAAYPCLSPGAWRASVAGNGGTPGAINSVAGSVVVSDTLVLGRWQLPSLTTLVLPWNQPLDSLVAADAVRWQLVAQAPVAVQQVRVAGWPHQQVVLTLSAPLDTNQQVVLLASGLRRCDGTALPSSRHLLFRPLVDVSIGAVRITEVMWDPPTGGVRYLELENRTGQAMWLNGARIVRTAGAAQSAFDSVALAGVVLPPYRRVALSDDTLWVRQHYQSPDSALQSLLPRRLPALDPAGGMWRLVGPRGQELDRVTPSRNQHHPSLRNPEGIALERQGDRWQSAAGPRYGTPGWRNSDGFTGEGFGFRLLANHLSPNDDGHLDELQVAYQLAQGGYQARLRVYDRAGLLVAELPNPGLLPTTGVITWNGRDRWGRLSSVGLYVLVIEAWLPGQPAQVARLPFALSLPQ